MAVFNGSHAWPSTLTLTPPAKVTCFVLDALNFAFLFRCSGKAAQYPGYNDDAVMQV